MRDDEDIKMDNGELEVETHKFIIPDLRQRTQPGLEVSRFAEHETPSPEVASPQSPFRSEVTPHAPQAPRDGGQGSGHSQTRGPGPTASRGQLPRQSDDSQVRLRAPTSVSVSPRLQSMKIEDPPPLPPSPEGKKQRRILGLPAVRFWILVVITVLVVIAIALGIALGVTRNNQSCAAAATSSPSGSPLPTPTDQGVAGVTSPAPINQYCPEKNDSVIVPYDASGSPIVFNQEQPMLFRMLCNTYWPAKGRGNPSLRDILVVYTPDMYTCMGLCASYNSGYSDAVGDDVFLDGGGICVAVALVRGPAQFCHLQNATGTNDTHAAFGHPVDTAVLVGDWAEMSSENQTLAFGGNLPEVSDDDEE